MKIYIVLPHCADCFLRDGIRAEEKCLISEALLKICRLGLRILVFLVWKVERAVREAAG